MCDKFPYNDLDILINVDFNISQRVIIFERLRGLIIEILVQFAFAFNPSTFLYICNLLKLSNLHIFNCFFRTAKLFFLMYLQM